MPCSSSQQEVTYDSYMKKLQERKGVVEERIMGEEFRSPECPASRYSARQG